MADPTATNFRERYSEFAADTYPDATITGAIATAMQISNVSEEAILACTAHLLTIRAQETGKIDGGAGEVQWEMQGRRQVQYVTMAKQGGDRASFFTTTAYGRLFLTLQDAAPRIGLSAMLV